MKPLAPLCKPPNAARCKLYLLLAALSMLGLNSPTAVLASFSPAAYNADLLGTQKAFPTAEGFGKLAQGGRGGVVYQVTNLNDSGPGSLRDCVEASGPRTCVFAVSGEIRAQSAIRAREPYLTIAGQTAPGDGIMLTIRDTDSLTSPLTIQTDHVIVRHIAVRPGPSREISDNVDAVLLTGRHIILDHVTMSWGTDETLNSMGNSGITNRSGQANSENITIQWSMIYESLRNSTHTSGDHSRSTYLGYGTQDITFHHNIIANSTRRNPNIGGVGQIDFINNVMFNNEQLNGELYNRHGSSYFNWIGNVSIAGPSTIKNASVYQADLFNNQDLGKLKMYVKDNIDIHRPSNSGDERLVIDPKDYALLSTSEPVGYGELSLSSSEISGPNQAYRDVLDFAGATRPRRDAADERFVADVRQCLGTVIDHPDEVGGWPVLSSATAPADTDADGMPDSWEQARGLNPNDSSDRNGDDDADGYTNLEEYLNQLAGDDDGSVVGQGVGPDPHATCGYSFRSNQAPRIKWLTISPLAAKPGQPVTISWSADADVCKRSWDKGGDPFLLTGSQTVSFDESSSIDLICARDNVDDWQNRYLFVNADGTVPAPQMEFVADNYDLEYGEAVTLSWRAGGVHEFEAGECLASGAWSGYKTTAGAETFSVLNSGEYYLTCTGPGGSTTDVVWLDVSGRSTPAPAPKPVPVPPTASLIAVPSTIEAGDSSVLTWTSTAVNSCSGDGFSTAGSISGSVSVSPAVDTTYSVSCAGQGGTATDSATIIVTVPPNPLPGGVSIGSAVETTRYVEVRSNPGGAAVALQPSGSSGIVIAGPLYQDGFTWFKVDFDSDPDGWLRGDSLEAL